MKKPRGSWGGSDETPRPASEVDIRYGHGLLEKVSSAWPSYFVVTTPSAYGAAQPHLGRKPEEVSYSKSADWSHLQEITDTVPDNVELIVGIGGGTAIDACKYVALKKELPVVLVPTIVSTGAIIHGTFPKWQRKRAVDPEESWPWIDCEYVLVDYEAVHRAPYYLNTAGLGDVLCSYAPLAEWRRKTRLGIGPPLDQSEAAPVIQHQQHILTGFPGTLTPDAGLTDDSIRFIMTAVKDRDSNSITNPAAPPSEHDFWQGAEEVNEKGWVHGEGVALGAVVVAWHCEESPETLIGWLDACRVRVRPREIGVTREELRKALEFAPSFMSDVTNGRDVDSVLRHEPLVGERLDALWQFLESV